MLKVKSLTVEDPDWPERLSRAEPQPKRLYVLGADFSQWIDRPCLAVVGSRRVTAYGQVVTTKLVSELARVGVVIISGLAIGADGLAHQAALKVGGTTAAVLGTGLDKIYPARHQNLAQQIIDSGGALISELANGSPGLKHNFIARNRLIAALSEAVLITEAGLRSGSLHTARFALEQGKTVMAVPGDITRDNSAGCNQLIKSGALTVTSVEDVFLALGLNVAQQAHRSEPKDPQELSIYKLITGGQTDQAMIGDEAKLEPAQLNATLTALELGGYIRPAGAGQWLIN